MSSLVVGGVAIKVAVSSPRWTRSDGVDRSRSLDGTLRASQTGGAVRVWDFETPPVLAATEGETYKAALSTVASQLCSGDIIALPTMCSAELTDGVPTAVAGEPYVVLSFTLHEQQPAKVLLRYAAGDTITGESFSRSTVGSYITAAGLVASAAINVKRDSHYIGGVRSTLLEGAAQNDLLWSDDLSNGAWSKITCTQGGGIADPAGGSLAYTITATGANALLDQTLAASANIVRTASVWLKRRTGTGTISILTPDGSAYTPVAITASWARYSVTGATGTGRQGQLKIATSGDAVDVWRFQVEAGPFSTSEIQTTTAATTRNADSYSLPFTTPPQEMTVYAKFVESGTILTTNTARIFEIANAADAAELFACYALGTYRGYHNAPPPATSIAPFVTAMGDSVELNTHLFGDGSVDITQSINGSAATYGAQTGNTGLSGSFSGPLCWLNSGGSSAVGFTALQSFKIISGSRSLAEARAL